MLSINDKKEILRVLNLVKKLNIIGIQETDINKKNNNLLECYDAIIILKKILLKKAEEEIEVINLLDSYCEYIVRLIEEPREITALGNILQEVMIAVIKHMENIRAKYKIVFLPYKASMWDSLESIWLAAKQDERCECFVVPIPYYKKSQNGGVDEFCYEGKNFPEYVPIVDYREYILEEELPDVVYIHNPYDEYNHVTRVDSRFFSHNLKKYTNKLVYVPYYVTAGMVSENQKQLSVYRNMDYMIAQSKEFKEGFKDYNYYNKILALGSPKFDRVIKDNVPTIIPADWSKKIEKKKVVMLNTSLNCFLHDGERMFQKLKLVFETFSRRQDVVLIWRPHPLMKATVNSLRPRLKKMYEELMQFFISNEVGILDSTDDITNTIAIADAYIGELSSSVVYLFTAAGKPIFILDNSITGKYSLEEQRTLSIMDMVVMDDSRYFVSHFNGLFKADESWNSVGFCGRIPNQNKWGSLYARIIDVDGKVFLAPYDSNAIMIYDLSCGNYEVIEELTENALSIIVETYEDKIIMLLQYKAAILVYNKTSKSMKRIDDIYGAFSAVIKGKYTVEGYSRFKDYLYIPIRGTNRVFKFSMNNERSELLEFSDGNYTFSAIICDKDYLYLAEEKNGDILRVNKTNNQYLWIKMPSEFIPDISGREGRPHKNFVDMGEYIITIPEKSNLMMKINKETKECHPLIPEFWKPLEVVQNGYTPDVPFFTMFAKKLDNRKIIVQRACDNAVAEIDVVAETYNLYYPRMSEETYEQLVKDENGFERIGDSNRFLCKENRFFSLDSFLEFLTHGDVEALKAEQLRAISDMAENLDGTCGEKVHTFMMDVLNMEACE